MAGSRLANCCFIVARANEIADKLNRDRSAFRRIKCLGEQIERERVGSQLRERLDRMCEDSEWVRLTGARRYLTVACFSLGFAIGIGVVIFGMAAAMGASSGPAFVMALGSWLFVSLFIFGLTVNPGKSLYLLIVLIVPWMAILWGVMALVS